MKVLQSTHIMQRKCVFKQYILKWHPIVGSENLKLFKIFLIAQQWNFIYCVINL